MRWRVLFLLSTLSLIAHPARGDDIADRIDTYAAQYLNRGDVLVGINRSGQVSWYGTGALSPSTPVQIGSITKGMVGLLLAAQMSAGVISDTTTVADLWPREDGVPSPPERLGSLPLVALATHTAGLPRVGLRPSDILRGLLRPDDPYSGLDHKDVLHQAAAAQINRTGSFSYSNLGYAVLGVLLAHLHADAGPIAWRLEDSMSDWVTVPLTGRAVVMNNPPALAEGYARNGRRAEAWSFGAYAGAGAAVVDAATLSLLAHRLVDLPVPFRDAIHPRISVRNGLDVGFGWFVEQVDADRRMIWHNGSTGSFASFVAAIPTENASIVVVTNTSVPVDALGRAILLDHSSPTSPGGSSLFAQLMAWLLIVAVVCYPVRILIAERSLMPSVFRPRNHLLPVLESGVGLVFGIAVWSRVSPGYLYSPWTRTAFLFIVALGVAAEAVRQWPRQSTLNKGKQLASIARVTLFTVLAIVYW